ncbi:MAG: hypothetical protein JNK05_18970 [Myxococcales bacterium]|nr:hypothetical protein [Myxococcales bacterium]
MTWRMLSRRDHVACVALVAAASSLVAPEARAIEYDIHAESLAQAYQVRGPFGTPVLSTRRFTQTLTLAATHSFGERAPALAFRVRLRFDGEFGDACGGLAGRCLEETTRERRTDFVPGFERRSVDLPYAYFEANNLLRGALDLRIGRVLSSDVLGFFAFDGARARAYLGRYATIEAYGGLEVRGGFALSNARFERDGVLRLDRSAWEPSLAPYVSESKHAPVVAVAIETAPWLPAFARATYRRVWTSDGTSEERIGAAVDAQLHPRVRLEGRAAYSLPHRAFSVLGGSVRYDDRAAGLSVDGGFERIRPTFDPSSIWAAIWADGVDEARVRVAHRGRGPWTFSAIAHGRRYAQSESGPSTNAASSGDRWHGGGTIAFVYDGVAWDVGARASGEAGAIGARGGLDLDASFEPWAGRLRFDGRASLWGNYDASRPERTGPTLALVAGAATKLGPIAWLHVDGEWDANAIVGHRARLQATLVIGAQP